MEWVGVRGRNLVEGSAFQAEYEGSIPFTRSIRFHYGRPSTLKSLGTAPSL